MTAKLMPKGFIQKRPGNYAMQFGPKGVDHVYTLDLGSWWDGSHLVDVESLRARLLTTPTKAFVRLVYERAARKPVDMPSGKATE